MLKSLSTRSNMSEKFHTWEFPSQEEAGKDQTLSDREERLRTQMTLPCIRGTPMGESLHFLAPISNPIKRRSHKC